MGVFGRNYKANLQAADERRRATSLKKELLAAKGSKPDPAPITPGFGDDMAPNEWAKIKAERRRRAKARSARGRRVKKLVL